MSTRFPPILRGSPKGMFETIHLPNEEMGEIDPFFIGKYYNSLGNRWNVYDPDEILHQIEFNKSLLNPLITFGWPQIRNYYRWTNNIKLSFYYYGENSFLMVVCERDESVFPSDFPLFHGLSTSVGDYRSFQITINDTNLNSSSLVLPQEFANFISLCEYSKIKLFGPLNHIAICKLHINTQNGTTVKFGQGWKKFCENNNIREGNCLEFTTDGHMYTNVIIVEKL